MYLPSMLSVVILLDAKRLLPLLCVRQECTPLFCESLFMSIIYIPLTGTCPPKERRGGCRERAQYRLDASDRWKTV